LPDSPPAFTDFHPIVLCTASRRVQGAEASEGGYIQGAADDHEAWSHGLSPPVFWKNKDLLVNTSEEDAPDVISKLVAEEAQTTTPSTVTLVKPTTRLFISTSQNIDMSAFDIVISCTPERMSASSLKAAGTKYYLHLKCNAVGKLGSRDLRSELPLLAPFLSSLPLISTDPKILICCPTGKDLSVGTALAILCLFTSNTGAIDLSTQKSGQQIDKNFIKQRLSWITMSNPTLNPSRATLQSVNTVLLASQDPKAINLPIRPRVAEEETIQSHSPSELGIQAKIFNTFAEGPWTFHRTLTSALPTHPSGTVTGTATFTPCALSPTFPPTLLYEENGEFVMENGLKASARRKYIYQLISPPSEAQGNEESDGEIVVKFHTDSDLPSSRQRAGVGAEGEGIGDLFVEMGPLSPGGTGEMAATNKSQHLCAADLYSASWKFGGGITGAEGGVWWEVRYDVKGPKKEYVSWTRYERGT
jgi:tRNA A64-2'-O-ribosylphosphate transferase